MTYTIIASTFTGNLGGASMLEAAIQTLQKRDPKARFYVYSVYPERDRRANTYPNVEVVSAKPLVLALLINPLALLYKVLVPLRGLLAKINLVRPLAEADVYLDQGGVTFVKGRTVFLIYNVATILPALIVGVPVVKCSQALGAFDSWLNRTLAKLFLPATKQIFARGALTNRFLSGLKLTNVTEAADYAFLLQVSKQATLGVDELFKRREIDCNKEIICIVPSKVVRTKVQRMGKDYVAEQQKFIKQLLARGFQVVLLPHSTRFYTNESHNNDVPVSRAIAAGMTNTNFHFIDEELNAQQVRAVIGRCSALITSRFHGMVSGLATSTPTLVVGWSHKYQEVMDQFYLSGYALSTKDFSAERLEKEFTSLYKDRVKIKRQITTQLPLVVESAQKQVEYIIAVAKK